MREIPEVIDWPQIFQANEAAIRAHIASKVEEEGDCLVWIGAKDTYGAPVMRVTGWRKIHPVRRILASLDGQDIDGKLMAVTCDCKDCIRHIKPVTRKALQKKTARENPYAQSIVRNKRISDSARERMAKLTIEAVQEMRSSGLSSRAASKQYGVAQSTASDILSHRTWRTYASPWAGL